MSVVLAERAREREDDVVRVELVGENDAADHLVGGVGGRVLDAGDPRHRCRTTLQPASAPREVLPILNE
jgi:hypothetical protein